MQSEKEFLANYDPDAFKHPSVTSDILIFTVIRKSLAVLLITRRNHPFKDKLAIPGGFLNTGQESSEEAAYRELKEETGITDISLRQLATFSKPDRDPRTHVVSVVYMGLVPYSRLKYTAGDDAADADVYRITVLQGEDCLLDKYGERYVTCLDNIAFDHGEIIRTGIQRLQGRLEYTDDSLELLEDPDCFTMRELHDIHCAILQKDIDPSNFRKGINRRYLKTGIMQERPQTTTTKTYQIRRNKT